jgi:Flp pilus assembly protein TadB
MVSGQTGPVEERRTVGRALGWTLAGFLCIVILLETIALTVIAVFVSVPLAIAVPFVVAAIALLIVRDARRHARR